MEFDFKRSVLKQLKYYRKKNPFAYKIINQKLIEISENPTSKEYKKVRKYSKYKRARVGSFRICFRILDNSTIYIGRIDDRSKVYK